MLDTIRNLQIFCSILLVLTTVAVTQQIFTTCALHVWFSKFSSPFFHAVFLERITVQAVSKRSPNLQQNRIKQTEEPCVSAAQ